MNYYTNSSNSRPSADLYWGRYNTAFLRGTLGMDAYGITYSPDYFNPESEMYDENIANTRKYLNVTNQQDYRGLVELLVFHYTSSGTGNKLYSTSQQGTSSTSITGWVHTNSVERMNQGQISEYPYVIGQELDVALTHSQYTALNMEDEELTVWYTLDSRKGNAYYKYTEGDGSNNYYIYSKGNITYTGSGHQSGSTTNEQKLFFNTVIASIKAGNFEPAVEFPEAGIDANGRYVVYHQNNDDVKITFQPIDYDAEKNTPGVFTSSKIYIDVDGVDGYSASGNDILLYDYESEKSSDWVSEIYNISNVNNKITEELKGSNLINKNKYSFIFKNSSINAYNSQIIALGKKDENGKIIDIYACPIVVEVTDAGLKNNPDEKTTARNKIYLVKTETNLFELD